MDVVGPLLTIHLVVAAQAVAPPAVVDLAVAEAAALWEPHAVAITRDAAGAAGPTLRVIISAAPLHLSDAHRASGPARPLGAIAFAADGTARNEITISMDGIYWLVRPAISSGGLAPPAADALLARVVGRVLAHEVGHYILRFPAHTPTGLMAARANAVVLTGTDRRAFALSPLLEPRLRAVLRLEAERNPRP